MERARRTGGTNPVRPNGPADENQPLGQPAAGIPHEDPQITPKTISALKGRLFQLERRMINIDADIRHRETTERPVRRSLVQKALKPDAPPEDHGPALTDELENELAIQHLQADKVALTNEITAVSTQLQNAERTLQSAQSKLVAKPVVQKSPPQPSAKDFKGIFGGVDPIDATGTVKITEAARQRLADKNLLDNLDTIAGLQADLAKAQQELRNLERGDAHRAGELISTDDARREQELSDRKSKVEHLQQGIRQLQGAIGATRSQFLKMYNGTLPVGPLDVSPAVKQVQTELNEVSSAKTVGSADRAQTARTLFYGALGLSQFPLAYLEGQGWEGFQTAVLLGGAVGVVVPILQSAMHQVPQLPAGVRVALKASDIVVVAMALFTVYCYVNALSMRYGPQ